MTNNQDLIEIDEYPEVGKVKVLLTGPMEYIPYETSINYMYVGNYIWRSTIMNL